MVPGRNYIGPYVIVRELYKSLHNVINSALLYQQYVKQYNKVLTQNMLYMLWMYFSLAYADV